MRATRLPLASLLLLFGCRAAPPPAPAAGDGPTRELEARVARLEAQARAASIDDRILELEVERAGLLVTYAAGHPAVLDVERRIHGLEKERALEDRARRDAMLRRLEAERERLLVTYAPEHPSVRKLDAKIAFLKSAAG